MADRSSNGEYKYQREDSSESKPRIPLEKERDEKDHQADKAGEYVRELLQEKLELDGSKWPNAHRLIDQEIQKTQAIGKPLRDPKYVDIYREKPIRVAVKVLVPVREHPKFNFVGKLLGPKGNSMKRLQEETMCKMAVLGRGSMKDRQKEEECRQSLDPKYAHLSDDLHVEIAALAPPAEAHARIAFALAEVRKYLIPDNNDNIRQEQMREMELSMADDPSAGEERRPSARGGGILRPSSRPTVPRSSRVEMEAVREKNSGINTSTDTMESVQNRSGIDSPEYEPLKRKRKRYNFREKKEIVQQAKIEGSKTICKKYKIGESTLRKWKAQEDDIVDSAKTANLENAKKATNTEEFDRAMYAWLMHFQSRGIPVNGPLVRQKALELNEYLQGPKDFKASKGWLDKWKKRMNL